MAATSNLAITKLEVGQSSKEVTINTALETIDAKCARALPDAASAPATTGLAPGSTYYNTTDSKVYWLRPNLTWVALT
jgi:hypothetical protein